MITNFTLRSRLALTALSVAALALGAASAAQATQHGDGAMMKDMPMQAQPGMTSMVQGEVKKIDRSAGKITIKHGEIRNMGMPPMTMVFRVKDPAMLDQAKVGDKINFEVDRVGGAMTITKLEPAK